MRKRMLNRRKRRLLVVILLVLLIPAGIWISLYLSGKIPAPGEPARGNFNMSDRIATLDVEERDGEVVFVFSDLFGGDEGTLTPEEFAAELLRREKDLPRIYRILDVTGTSGLLWLLFGLLAQAVFMGRLLIQWSASEKAKTSVVPPVFWWFSLLGSSMLLIYFLWRKEPIGLLGQATGWFIYVRNLWFIYGKPRVEAAATTSSSAEEK